MYFFEERSFVNIFSVIVPAQDDVDKNGDNSVLTDECKGIVYQASKHSLTDLIYQIQ